ncbi:MAG: hypothetical protein KGL39_17635 [Patescibacteria group bacterium]|nr:hypothetical protein [Patescibacteria group bacterium]
MDLDTAQRYAAHILGWLRPHCDRLEVAGSIRRGRPVCNDVDIVCIPCLTEYKDLLGHVTGRQNQVHMFLLNYVADYQARHPGNMGQEQVRVISGGETVGKQMIVQLPKCQLDVWFATEATFASLLLCRTGSKEHNIWLCQRAVERDIHWNPYEGLSDQGGVLPARSEEELYKHLGLAFIEPKNRELPWIQKNLEYGL